MSIINAKFLFSAMVALALSFQAAGAFAQNEDNAPDEIAQNSAAPSLTLSGRVTLMESRLSNERQKDLKSENKKKPVTVFLPCRAKRGKSGYRNVELATTSGVNFDEVVNHRNIPSNLSRESLRVIKH